MQVARTLFGKSDKGFESHVFAFQISKCIRDLGSAPGQMNQEPGDSLLLPQSNWHDDWLDSADSINWAIVTERKVSSMVSKPRSIR